MTGYQTKVRPEKAKAVDEIKAELGETTAVVLTEYRGLTVQALKELRAQLEGAETSYRVVKNTLARLAVGDLGFGGLVEVLTGPTAIAYVKGDPVTAAKVIATFAKDHPELIIKGGVLDGRIMTADEAKGLASVDMLDTSRAKIAGLLTAALRQVTYVLEAPARQILYVLEEIAKRGGASVEAPAPEAEAAAPEAEAAAPEASAEPEAAAPEAAAVEEVTEEAPSEEQADDTKEGA